MLSRMLLLVFGALAVAAPQTLLVLNKEDATLWFVDPRTGSAGARVAVGEGPHEMALDPAGKLAFVANYGTARTPGSTISVIDVAAGKELRRIDLGVLRRPHGLCVSGGKLYFTAEANRLIGRYDPAANQVDWLMGTGQTGTHMVLASADGATLFTANIGSDTIGIFQGNTHTVVPVGKGPEGVDLSPDGKFLWTSHSRDGGVSVIDVAARKVVYTFDAGTRRSNRIKLTPDGKFALISDLEGNEVVVVDAETRRIIRRLQPGRTPEGILIPPGGTEAYIALAGDDRIAVIDLKSFEIVRRLSTGKGPDGMAWLP
jgi:DNA-binding beta-propeller fold protein YncE